MNLLGHDIGVCSWSLRPTGVPDLLAKLKELELSHLQLALGELLELSDGDRAEAVGQIKDSGVTLTAAMIGFPGEDYASIRSIRRTGGLVPDDRWPERERLTLDAAGLARDLGIKLLTTHVGFIPAPNDANYASMVDRICGLTTSLADMGLELLMETGQEAASELLQFMNNLRCKNFGVNFDPANMILYGSGDPIDAIKTLGKHVRHVHIKDAIKSKSPGLAWGVEVPFGDGEVPHEAFIDALESVNYRGPLVIEREAGDDRTGDVQYAIETLRRME